MRSHNGNYDFHYSGEGNLIVFAVENDDYYSLMLQADARTLDLSGGTRCIETIKLQKCRKMSRIIWPFDCGRIRSLSIYAADQLYQLDLTPLYNLESLSIIDCEALTSLQGLPSQLKNINLHNTGIRQLDLQHVSDIHSLNLHSTLRQFKVIAERRNYLQHVTIKVQDQCQLHSNLTNCPILHDVYIDGENAKIKLNIKNSNSLKELTVNGGSESSIYGLADCKQIKYARHSVDVTLKDMDPALLQQRINKNCRHDEYHSGDLAKKFADAQLQFQIDATAHNPHYDDKETVIQHINSRREFEQGIGATLSLLSHPMEHVIEISQHDLRKMKKLSTDSRPQFLVESTLTPFYILGSDLSPRPERLIKNAKTTHNSPDPINDCITSSDTILLITDKDLSRKPLLKKLLFLLRNPQFKLHTVFLAGKLATFDQYIPGLSRKALPIALPTRKDQEVLLYQDLATQIGEIYDLLTLSADKTAFIAAATAFTAAINSFTINIEVPKANSAKSWPSPDTQDAVDGSASHKTLPDFNEAIPIDAEASKTEHPHITAIPALTPDTPPEQQLLGANKIATQLIPEPTDDQVLLEVNKQRNEYTNHERLLKAARDLAIATQQLVNSATDQHSQPSDELKRADILIKTVNRELEPTSSQFNRQDELLAVAKTLADGIKALVDACRSEAVNTTNPTSVQEIQKDITKKND